MDTLVDERGREVLIPAESNENDGSPEDSTSEAVEAYFAFWEFRKERSKAIVIKNYFLANFKLN